MDNQKNFMPMVNKKIYSMNDQKNFIPNGQQKKLYTQWTTKKIFMIMITKKKFYTPWNDDNKKNL